MSNLADFIWRLAISLGFFLVSGAGLALAIIYLAAPGDHYPPFGVKVFWIVVGLLTFCGGFSFFALLEFWKR